MQRFALDIHEGTVSWNNGLRVDGKLLPHDGGISIGDDVLITGKAIRKSAEYGISISGKSSAIVPRKSRWTDMQLSALPRRDEVARSMVKFRFGACEPTHYEGMLLEEARMMATTYRSMFGNDFRRELKVDWKLCDWTNRMISTANNRLYSLTLPVLARMGFVFQLGFLHRVDSLSFMYDVADLYKIKICLAAVCQARDMSDPTGPGTVVNIVNELWRITKTEESIEKDLELLLT